jgi:hypothetical protein
LEVVKSYTAIAREWGLHPTEVSTVVVAAGVEPQAVGLARLLTPRQVKQIEPQLRRLKDSKVKPAAQPSAG